MHDPGGPGTEKLATNVVSLLLGSPVKLLRAIKGARFVQGSVNDPDRLSVCSFYVDGEEAVKKSSNVYEANLEAMGRFKSMAEKPLGVGRYQSNLCQEVYLGPSYPSSFPDVTDDSTLVESQTIRDIHLARLSRMTDRVGGVYGVHAFDRWANERPIGAMTTTIGGPHDTFRAADFDGDVTAEWRNVRQGAMAELADMAARQINDNMGRNGFLRQMTRAQELTIVDEIDREIVRELTLGRQNSRNEASRRINRFGEELHTQFYDEIARSASTVTYRTDDIRPHLPQNQRNRGPVPRNQRW